MALPTINSYAVNDNEIKIYWKSQPQSDNVAGWWVYGSSSVAVSFTSPNKGLFFETNPANPGCFTKLKYFSNYPSEMTPGSILASFSRADLGIEATDTYYFAISSVDRTGAESPLETFNIHACPYYDMRFIDEAGWPVNVVYKNIEFDLPSGLITSFDRNTKLDVISLMGRPSKELKAQCTGGDVQIKINSFNSDPITLKADLHYPIDFKRGEMEAHTIYVINTSGTAAKVSIFLAG